MSHPLRRIGIAWNQWRLRRAGLSPNGRVFVGGSFPRFNVSGHFSLGSACGFRNLLGNTAINVFAKGKLTFADNVWINEAVRIDCVHSIELGQNTLVGEGVMILDTNFHDVEQGAPVKTAPVSIGKNVWLGSRSIILPGVTIGDHSVIGAGSVVTRSIPSHTLAAGSPCTAIRSIECSDDYTRSFDPSSFTPPSPLPSETEMPASLLR